MSAGASRTIGSNSNPQCWPHCCRWGAQYKTMAVSVVNSSMINRSATVINVHQDPEVPLNLKPSQLLLSGWAASHLPLPPAAWPQTAAKRPTAYLPPTFAA